MRLSQERGEVLEELGGVEGYFQSIFKFDLFGLFVKIGFPLCSFDFPGTHSVDQAELELVTIPLHLPPRELFQIIKN